MLPFDGFELQIVSRSRDKERAYFCDTMQPSEVVIATVEDIKRSRFIWYLVHVVDRGYRNMEEGRHLTLKIVKGMDLNPAFCSTKTGRIGQNAG